MRRQRAQVPGAGLDPLRRHHFKSTDLFPGKAKENTDYGLLLDEVLAQIEDKHLQRKKEFVLKTFQLYDVMSVRHGLMLVSPTGGRKTAALHVLKDAISALDGQSDFHKVRLYTLKPQGSDDGRAVR